MTVATYWALSVEDSLKHKPAAEAYIKAADDARNYISERIECDGVFFTEGRSIYLGFKRRQENPQLHKKPATQHKGQYLYTTKVKSEWNTIVAEAEKIARSAAKFQDYCRELWSQSMTSIMGSQGSSFTLSTTAFGFLGDRVVMMLPVSDGELIDPTKVPEGFTELTASQYAALRAS